MPRPLESVSDKIWILDSGAPGPTVCISFGVHGNERSPVDAGLLLREALEDGTTRLRSGRLLLVHANPRATEEDQRWSADGVDLNRCFSAEVLAREPVLYEEHRAHEIVAALLRFEPTILVDFHCTVEPGRRFLMQHPPTADPAHRAVRDLLRAEVLLADPDLEFGGVSFDEWMSTRGKVGICYETGWKDDPENTPEFVLGEMLNVLRGLGLIEGDAEHYPEKELLQLSRVVRCEGDGFAWRDGIGENLQALPAGTVLGAYGDGSELALDQDATLVFPKKRPELVKQGAPLVYLAIR